MPMHGIRERFAADLLAVQGKLRDYRFVDNVWTFNLASAKFKGADALP